MVKYELHSHSIMSDGCETPTQVVRDAKKAGVRLLALSDHDSMKGVEEAIEEGIETPVANKPVAKPAEKKAKKEEKTEEKSLADIIIDLNEDIGKDRQISFRGDKNLLKELKYATFELEVSQQEFIVAAIRMLIEKVNDGESR